MNIRVETTTTTKVRYIMTSYSLCLQSCSCHVFVVLLHFYGDDKIFYRVTYMRLTYIYVCVYLREVCHKQETSTEVMSYYYVCGCTIHTHTHTRSIMP